MANEKGLKNARRIYTQQVLSGFEHLNQPEDENGNSSQNEQGRTEKLPPKFWEQKSYQVSISVIIEKTSTGSNQHEYSISLNADSDILIAPIAKSGKKTTQSPHTIHREKVTKTRKIPMVYGIHKAGVDTLSYPARYPTSTGVTEFYSYLLGQIDRAIECTIQQQEITSGNDDSGQRSESPPTPKNVGSNKAKRRGSKILPKIRNEALSEVPPKVDDINGAVLGGGSSNTGDRLDTMGNDTFVGTGLENVSLDF